MAKSVIRNKGKMLVLTALIMIVSYVYYWFSYYPASLLINDLGKSPKYLISMDGEEIVIERNFEDYYTFFIHAKDYPIYTSKKVKNILGNTELVPIQMKYFKSDGDAKNIEVYKLNEIAKENLGAQSTFIFEYKGIFYTLEEHDKMITKIYKNS